jgi:hypothetical protein
MAERLVTFCRHLPSVRTQDRRIDWYCRLCGSRLPEGDRLGGGLGGGPGFGLAKLGAASVDSEGFEEAPGLLAETERRAHGQHDAGPV